MTAVQDAIAALSPSIWYRLDETSGTVATNHGSQSNNGTYSGSYAQGLPGPETGTFATRLYSGGQIVSGVMDLAAFYPQTLAMFVSMDASGAINTNYPILGIGDISNRLNRGPQLLENHSSIGQPVWGARYPPNIAQTRAAPQPYTFWHWVVAVFNTGTNATLIYVDGVGTVATLSGTPANPIASDPLLIRCDEPIVVAHVCWWGSVLTQAQIQSVSNQIALWPPTQPINTPPEAGGGGGGLTPDQATQLSDIHGWTQDIPGLVSASNFISSTVNTILGVTNSIYTDTQNIVNTLFPQLETPLNTILDTVTNILNGITTTVDNAGTLITATLGQIFKVNPLNTLTSIELTSGPTCERIDQVVIGPFAGIRVTITQRPDSTRLWAPDLDFAPNDYCSVRLEVAGQLYARYGVHQLDWTTTTFPATQHIGFDIFRLNVTLPDTHVIVDWAPGVCGQVWLQKDLPAELIGAP